MVTDHWDLYGPNVNVLRAVLVRKHENIYAFSAIYRHSITTEYA